MAGGTQDYVADSRNDAVLISINGALVPRAEAKVSVFDSGFVLDSVRDRRSTALTTSLTTGGSGKLSAAAPPQTFGGQNRRNHGPAARKEK